MTKKMKYNTGGILAAAILVLLDQWTKRLAVLHLKGQEAFVIWEGVFELRYLENHGAAFGILQGQRGVFLLCTAVVLFFIGFYYNRLPEQKRFTPFRLTGVLLAAFGILQGQRGVFLLCTAVVLFFIGFYYNRLPEQKRFTPFRLTGVLLVAGAVGNLIDRLTSSYVVDFLYFKLIDFPIFNVADCYVTVGAVLLAALIIFVYKEEDLEFLSLRKKHD